MKFLDDLHNFGRISFLTIYYLKVIFLFGDGNRFDPAEGQIVRFQSLETEGTVRVYYE